MFTFETRFNPYYLVFIATRENSKKTKREQYKFSCMSGTLELLLDSYEYQKRDSKGYYCAVRGWYRYPASKYSKKFQLLTTEDIPKSSSLKSALLEYVASRIKFAPFKGLKTLEKLREKEKETADKHWKKIKGKVKEEMAAKRAEAKKQLKKIEKEKAKAKAKAKEKSKGKKRDKSRRK